MIANKILSSFFVIDLDGDAANLEWLFGHAAKLKNVTIHSTDFSSDVEAIVAAQELFDVFKSEVDISSAEISTAFNPEFFNGDGALEPTLEQEYDEALAELQVSQMNSDRDVTVLTRRFDEWGDFVIMKTFIQNSNFLMRMKVAANPQLYILEKNLEQQEHAARLHGKPTPSDRLALH